MSETTESSKQVQPFGQPDLPNNEVIRGLVLDRATTGAIGSLVAWGAINLAGWYFLGADTRHTLSGIGGGANEFGFFMYGGAVIGATMLLFATIGAITRHAIVGWLDGLALMGVGLWNLVHDFALTPALQPHGYSTGSPGPIWLMLGCAQIVWGVKQISRFANLGSQPSGVDKVARQEARSRLQSLFRDPQGAPMRFTISQSGGFPFFSTTTRRYVGWLTEGRAICIETDLDSWFEIDGAAAADAQVAKNVATVLDREGNRRQLVLDENSLAVFRAWSGAQPSAPQVIEQESPAPLLEAGGQAS